MKGIFSHLYLGTTDSMLALVDMILTTIVKKITTILDFLRYFEDLLDTSLVSPVHHSQSQHSSSGPGIGLIRGGGGGGKRCRFCPTSREFKNL